jgi:uncharacterized protein (DUF433 family)
VKDDPSWTGYFRSKQDAITLRTRLPSELRQPIPYVLDWKREQLWPVRDIPVNVFVLEQEHWLEDQSRRAMAVLGEYVEASPHKLGGVPLFRGTRFSISQFLTELADSDAVDQVADNFEVNKDFLRNFLHAFAVYLNRPVP